MKPKTIKFWQLIKLSLVSPGIVERASSADRWRTKQRTQKHSTRRKKLFAYVVNRKIKVIRCRMPRYLGVVNKIKSFQQLPKS